MTTGHRLPSESHRPCSCNWGDGDYCIQCRDNPLRTKFQQFYRSKFTSAKEFWDDRDPDMDGPYYIPPPDNPRILLSSERAVYL